jgi:DNA-binding MarR family transcriptional regulator
MSATPIANASVTAPVEPDGVTEIMAVDLDLAALAIRLVDYMKKDIREIADEQGLSIAQLDVLRRLRHHGPSPMRRLAELMNCEASNLTGLVDRLEMRGLVERRPDPGDRRIRLLALTAEGDTLSHQTWVAVAQRCPFSRLAPERRLLLDELLREALRPPVRSGAGASASGDAGTGASSVATAGSTSPHTAASAAATVSAE